MKCDTVQELASDALDGLLDPALAARFDAHLEACPECRVFHEELRESLALLADFPVVEASPDFDRRVWARIREEGNPVGLRESATSRLAEWRERLTLSTMPWRLAPALAAGVALVILATTSGPVPTRDRTAGVVAPERFAAAPEALASQRAEADRPAEPFVVTTGDVDTEEFEAGMPRVVEEFLRNAPELRLPSPDRYRDSNYRYPLRRVQDPLGTPVSGGYTPASPMLQPVDAPAGAAVLSF
ncbi:MAG: zf-HC2 domain-containing protein [bacterium]